MSSIIVGAGCSFNLVPLPAQLIKSKKNYAEEFLGCNDIQSTIADGLYKWAEEVIAFLKENHQILPKLKLARALGILEDPEWLAQVGLPLRGTTARHRVLARLAVEKRFSRIWTLNWDCHLENALDRIGMTRGGTERRQPWATVYEVVVTYKDMRHVGDWNRLWIIKPHGCARSLGDAQQHEELGDVASAEELSERFMITQEELFGHRNSRTDRSIFLDFRNALQLYPFIILGWSVSEPYLKDVIGETKAEDIDTGSEGELTIVDVVFNDDGHKAVADLYQLKKAQIFVGVNDPTLDEVMLALQARYLIDQLFPHVSEFLQMMLQARVAELKPDTKDHFLFAWADDFIPSWVRLCWRAELVDCTGFRAHELRFEAQDLHIPWHIQGLPRPDLESAALLLCALPADGGQWDVHKFPGALFHKQNGRVVIPLPTWGNPNDLASIPPMLHELQLNIGYVSSIEVLPLRKSTAEVLDDEILAQLKEKIASNMRIAKYASADSINVATDLIERLEALST